MPPPPSEDAWINAQAALHAVADIEDCAIAVDATYYLQYLIDHPPTHEPLLIALGGLNGIMAHLEAEIDKWIAHRVTPLFIFDGQFITGQDDVLVARGRRAIDKTDHAWQLYMSGRAEEAVGQFGATEGAYRPQNLYPILQAVIKSRELHFIVAPYNAAAQIAHLDMIDSDQCGGIMGSQELLLYPIKDTVLRWIDWDNNVVTAISKKQITSALKVSDPMFIDVFLMSGTSFLPQFPALQDPVVIKHQPPNISDAVPMLHTAHRSVAALCSQFNDILQQQDRDWLDKYRRARMAVTHFIYIAEDGEVRVNDFDGLTGDNHEYLGLQLPSELFHYLNTGLIGPRILSAITHGKFVILPTVDGVASEEYKTLVTSQLVPIRECTFALLVPRLNRGILYKNIAMKVWYDPNFSYTSNFRSFQPAPTKQAETWNIKEATIREQFPGFVAGNIYSEVTALKNPDFAKATIAQEKPRSIESREQVISLTLWRFLHLRQYVNDQHRLTPWGSALSAALEALKPTVDKYVTLEIRHHLYESVVVAFELLRFELLTGRNLPSDYASPTMNGADDDKRSMQLIARCATLLKLRQQSSGYTGPLSKTLLTYQSLINEVKSADRDLLEAILASMFMYGQAKRDRDDAWFLSHELPFLFVADIAMGIAVVTFLERRYPGEPPEERAQRAADFSTQFMPYATAFAEDLSIAYTFFDALHEGVKVLTDKEISDADKAAWDRAAKYLAVRR